MPEKIYSSIVGVGSTSLGIVSGILNVSSIAEALVLGFVGATGGLIAHALWKKIKSYIKP